MCSENELGKPLGSSMANLSTIGAMHKFKCPTIYLEEFLRIAPDDRDMTICSAKFGDLCILHQTKLTSG